MDTARKRVGMKSINQSVEDLRDVAHGASDDEMHDSPLIRDRTLSADSDATSPTRYTVISVKLPNIQSLTESS